VHQLLGNLADFSLAQAPVIFEDFEELALRELCDHAKLMRSFERVKHQNYVLVVKPLQNLDFLPEIVHFLLSLAPASVNACFLLTSW
jgi:hypothetical protein